MNNKTLYILLAVLVIGCGAFFLLPSDEDKINDNLISLAENCSSALNESVIETMQKVSYATKLCAIPCKVQIESRNFNGEFSQKEMSDHILMLKKRLPNTTISFQDINISLINKTQANAIATLQINGSSVDGRFTDAYEVDISVNKYEGKWLFSSFTVVEFMKR